MRRTTTNLKQWYAHLYGNVTNRKHWYDPKVSYHDHERWSRVMASYSTEQTVLLVPELFLSALPDTTVPTVTEVKHGR
jgi:hypothetical protein